MGTDGLLKKHLGLLNCKFLQRLTQGSMAPHGSPFWTPQTLRFLTRQEVKSRLYETMIAIKFPNNIDSEKRSGYNQTVQANHCPIRT